MSLRVELSTKSADLAGQKDKGREAARELVEPRPGLLEAFARLGPVRALAWQGGHTRGQRVRATHTCHLAKSSKELRGRGW